MVAHDLLIINALTVNGHKGHAKKGGYRWDFVVSTTSAVNARVSPGAKPSQKEIQKAFCITEIGFRGNQKSIPALI